MGRMKLKKTGGSVVALDNVALASRLALDEYNARKAARKELAINQEIQNMTDQRDAFHENWMFGCFALILHRRYRYTASKIAEILSEVQTLHNDIYDGTLSYEETDRIIVEMVQNEVGMDITNDDLEMYKKGRKRI